jgi:hypothetical protein
MAIHFKRTDLPIQTIDTMQDLQLTIRMGTKLDLLKTDPSNKGKGFSASFPIHTSSSADAEALQETIDQWCTQTWTIPSG